MKDIDKATIVYNNIYMAGLKLIQAIKDNVYYDPDDVTINISGYDKIGAKNKVNVEIRFNSDTLENSYAERKRQIEKDKYDLYGLDEANNYYEVARGHQFDIEIHINGLHKEKGFFVGNLIEAFRDQDIRTNINKKHHLVLNMERVDYGTRTTNDDSSEDIIKAVFVTKIVSIVGNVKGKIIKVIIKEINNYE